jgi:hypothetical protein
LVSQSSDLDVTSKVLDCTKNPEAGATSGEISWNRYFQCHRRSLELPHFTRRLTALHIDKATFSQAFGTSPWKRYSEKLDLFVTEGFLDESRQACCFTLGVAERSADWNVAWPFGTHFLWHLLNGANPPGADGVACFCSVSAENGDTGHTPRRPSGEE